MKLWSKENSNTSAAVESFTVGNDRIFDLQLAPYDVLGSIAHVTMLGEQGLIPPDEAEQAIAALHQILDEIRKGNFKLDETAEDVHSQVEMMLTERIGMVGKKIHSGRSRNDQVATDIKLFLRDQILDIREQVLELFQLLIRRSNELKQVIMPGYTHLQMAMPSSFGLWLGAYAESLVDDMELLAAAWAVTNKNPLGSGAGYGSSFPLNRQRTTELLGFSTMNWNSVYAQMSRGKTEKTVAQALAPLAGTLARFSMDCCLFMNQHFGFIRFPDSLTTGSSIMPHKKNPDVFELVRAHCNRIQSLPNELALLMTNLPSGYHRDMQLTKEILFPALGQMRQCLLMTGTMVQAMEANESILNDQGYKYLFTVEAVNKLVLEGMPFRDAYKFIGNQVESGEFHYDTANPIEHTHEGSIGRLCNREIETEMQKAAAKIQGLRCFNP